MQIKVTTGTSLALPRVVLGLLLLAVCQSTGRGIEVPPTPGPPVPDKMQRLFALNIHTGEIAYDQTVRGPLQQASLSDGERVAYAVVAPGSRVLYPLSDVFVQDFAAPVSTILGHVGDHVNAVTVTDSRVAWAVYDYFKVHSTVDGTATFHDTPWIVHLRLSQDSVTYLDHSSYPSQIVVHDLATGESASDFNVDLPLTKIVSPRGFDAVRDALIGVTIKFGTDETKVAKLSRNAPPEYLPIAAYNLATNGEQIVFAGTNLAGVSSVGLQLYDAGHFTLLAASHEFEGNPWLTSEFSISANSIAWASGVAEDRRIWIRDIASGAVAQLPTMAPGLRLWDLNDDYILLSSDVVPVPEPSSCLLIAFAAGGMVATALRRGHAKREQ